MQVGEASFYPGAIKKFSNQFKPSAEQQRA
jgi:hypothetical protein